MTTREFIQHLILNCELDDPVEIEVDVPESVSGYISYEPAHATRIGDGDCSQTLIECRPWKGE